jgi:hypothetical protein
MVQGLVLLLTFSVQNMQFTPGLIILLLDNLYYFETIAFSDLNSKNRFKVTMYLK